MRERQERDWDAAAQLARRVDEMLEQYDVERASVMLPFDLPDDAAPALLALHRVTSVMVGGSEAARAAGDPRVGWHDPLGGEWAFPDSLAPTLFVLANEGVLGFRMVREARSRGVRRVAWLGPVDEPVFVGVERYLATRLRQRIWARAAARLLRSGESRLSLRFERRFARSFERLLRCFPEPLLSPGEFERDRILLVTGSLAAGGAERQVVNTLRGLVRSGEKDVSLVCEHLRPPLHDFHRWRLEEQGIPAEERLRPPWRQIPSQLRPRIKEALRAFDGETSWLGQEILSYVVELVERRPAVLHAWLDEPNVTAGVAAAIVGVPRVVLSCRAAAPFHFAFHQSFMRPGYRALLDRPGVTLLNNSAAGARSYAEWLGVPVGRIRVVHNGIERPVLPPREEIGAWRVRHGIAVDAPLVGGVGRLTEEKQPLLWVRTAAVVGRHLPAARFALIGGGPLLDEAERLAQDLGLGGRLVLPGPERDPSLAMAAMDVFLMTSKIEGLPNVLLEAQALGTPVVTTAAGGAVEALDPGTTGFVVVEHSAEPLAQRVLQILGDAEWAARARAAAPGFVERCFGMERMVRETLAVYRAGEP